MNGAAILFIVLGILTVLWMRGFLNLGGVMSLYLRIRLAALLWVAVITVIAVLRILGISGEGF